MEKVKVDELKIDGTIYVPKDSVKQVADLKDGMPYVLVRTYSAGVHAGFLKGEKGKQIELIEGRRIWKWKGASACSQLAQEGVRIENYSSSKIEMPSNYTITEAIEIHDMTKSGSESIQNAPLWKE